MLGCLFFLAFLGVAFYGFANGNFAYIILSAVLFIFSLAAWGMDAPARHTAGRPPSNPPGYRNRR